MERPSVLHGAWRFLKSVLIVVVVALLGTGGTFLIRGEFTWRAYSDRLFWVGIGVTVLGGFFIWSALGSYSTLGTPNVLTAPGDARIAHSRIKEHIAMNAKRYAVATPFLAAGALCMATSALIEILTR
jgi:hypothetical protein